MKHIASTATTQHASRPWETETDLAWCKLHDRWFTSPSHLGLDAVTLLVGLRCMLLANRRGRQVDGSGLVLDGTRKPLAEKVIALEARTTCKSARKSLALLCECGTMFRRDDGAYGFKNLQRWQEDPSAARQRARRDSHRDRHADSTPPSHEQTSDVRGSEDQRSEIQTGKGADAPVQPKRTSVAERITPFVDAYNRGVADGKKEGFSVPAKADASSPQSAKRDAAWLQAIVKFQHPDEWYWCARSLASASWSKPGEFQASIGWLLKRGQGATLEEWMSNGRALKEKPERQASHRPGASRAPVINLDKEPRMQFNAPQAIK